MDAGRLKHVIKIQSYTETNVGGDLDKSWSEGFSVRAEVQPVRANERVVGGDRIVSTELLKFLVRADDRIYSEGVDSKIRVVFNNKNYDVRSVAPLYHIRGIEILAELVK